jgi:protoporphyrinogen/coproporphyrinogen III oxidase
VSGPFENLDVIVIGGGISGLSAAHALRQRGRRVVLVEAAAEFGGSMGTLRSGGYIADRGPQTLVATPELTDLVRALGLEDRVMRPKPTATKRYIYRHGRLMALPMSPGALIATPLLSAGAKLRLLAEPFVGRRSDDADESIASFITRRAGAEVVDAIVAPFISGTYAGDPARLSVSSAAPALVRLEKEHGSVIGGFLAQRRQRGPGGSSTRPDIIGFADGNATLVDALVKSLDAKAYATARVERIRQRGAGFALDCEGLPERSVEAPQIIVATPADAAATLLEPLEPQAAAALRAIESPPLAQVVLAYPRASIGAALDGFGFLTCRNEGARSLGAVWNSVIFQGRCPDDEALLTVFLGGATDPSIARCSDADLVQIAHRDVSRIMSISDAKPKVIAGFRWTAAIPQYTIGHQRRLATIIAGVGRIPGLALIGNYLRSPRVADCVEQAEEAAQALTPA